MDAAYFIEIEQRRNSRGELLYGITVGQQLTKQACEEGDGLGSIYVPVYSRDAAVTKIRDLIDQYRVADNRQADRPAPTAHNTALQDSTGEFSIDEFFDCGTLDAFMA